MVRHWILIPAFPGSNPGSAAKDPRTLVIKVLGFFDGEVSAYIYRENIVSAVLGTVLGLVLGIFLSDFVISTAEVDAVMFAPDIPAYCFVYAALMTAVFAVAVNVILHFRLKKIDMAASLKAIE